ncbi:MAG: serine/threonine protein kinase, partial [Planctomycetes bacterium]|nr:serine/threonine protein kinase [Planctomycetota bacterium]
MADETKNQCPQCGADLPADAPQGICPKCLLKQGLQPETQAKTLATPPGGFVPPEPEQIAGDFPQLEIIELLGRGGMGIVYKARQKQLDRIVALKILPPDIGKDPAFAERFTREAKALAKLNHPQIVTIHDIGKTQSGLYYFVMEYVDGTDLRQVLQTGNLTTQEALAIVPQICQALQYAHDEGIVHRDIKPENILLDKKGRVKIADFGLARLLDKPAAVYTLTAVGQKMGTPHYMAPEQIAGSPNIDHRADIYSLGVVFYEMLTGQLPLGRFDPPSKKVQVDVRLDEIVLRTLEQEPARRYQHVSQVQTDIENIAIATSPAKAVSKEELTSEQALREQIKRPAIGLLVAASFDCLIGFFFILRMFWGSPATLEEGSSTMQVLATWSYIANIGIILSVIIAVFIIVAMIKMMNLQAYRLALAAVILGLIPTGFAFIVTFPFGLWALFALARKDVK